MTMAWGLEARTPFLDHELAELAAACPPELKLADGGKGVLKAAARNEHLTTLEGSKLWQLALLELWLTRLGI
jgi:asparagine synthetase B (glutamine-hydrolysing)